MIRVALAIKLAELATVRKNHGLQITATTFAELATTRKKSCTRTNPANMVQQLTKLHITPRGIVERAFSCSGSLCAQCA
jgi:hypothetical protein